MIEFLLNLDNADTEASENEIDIFDDFVSEKSRNLGIRINTRNYLKTYDEQETTELLNMLIKKVESKFKVKLNKS